MPNHDTHAGLAAAAYPDRGPEYNAGESFDDIVRMAGGLPSTEDDGTLFYLGRRNNNCITDPAFDSQVPLKAAVRAMRADIAGRGLDPRWARLAGPATDILYSGVSQQFSTGPYEQACDFLRSPSGQDLIASSTRAKKTSGLSHGDICASVNRIVRRGFIPEYADPEVAVDVLRRRVVRGTNVLMPDDSSANESLRQVFAAQQSRLAFSADEIYSGTVATMTGDPVDKVLARIWAPLLPVVPNVSSVTEKASNIVTIGHIDDWADILSRERLNKEAGNEQFERLLAASRAAAHYLLQKVARHHGQVTISRKGISAPFFPEPWLGSITHSQDWATAAIASTDHYRGLGIDLECRFKGTRGRDRVMTPLEQAQPELQDISTRTLFSIKEAVFKAIHPLVENDHPEKFWYQDAEITDVDIVNRSAIIRPSGTDRGRRVGKILGDANIECHYLEKPAYSSAVCVVN